MTSLDMKTKPYYLLDAMRGCAALWVVMLHVSRPGLPGPIYTFSSFGLLGVPMFFVISGYCIASAARRSLKAPRPVAHFLAARVRRIYPPYFFASLLAVLLSVLLALLVRVHAVQSSQLAALNVLGHGWRFYIGALTMTQVLLHTAFIIPVFWTLCYEAAFYAMVAAGLFLSLRLNWTAHFLDALGLLTLFALLWRNITEIPCPFPLNLWPQFGLGILVYQILAQPQRRFSQWLFSFSGLLIMIYVIRQGFGGFSPAADPLRFLFCLAFAVLLLGLFRWDALLSGLRTIRLLSWVGMFSYSLYLIHLLALGIINQIAQRIPFLASHAVLLYLVKIAMCITIGRLFFQFFERPFLTIRQKRLEQEILPYAL